MKEYIRRYFMLRRHNMKVAIKKAKMSKMCYAFLAPYAIIFALFYILPVITSIFYSFTYYNILESPKFVGLQNYINLILQDDVFLIGVKNTFVIAVITGPLGYIASFLFAWLINELPRWVRTIAVVVFYAPSIAGNAYVIFSIFFRGDAYGYVNAALMNMGIINSPILWLTDPDYMLPICMLVILWMSLGTGFLSFVAGLQGVDRAQYEAGYVDGIRNRWQELWYITLPNMKPMLLFGAVMSITQSFGVCDVTMALCGYPSTDYAARTVVTHLFDYGYSRFEMGYASAIATLLFLIMILCNKAIQSMLRRVAYTIKAYDASVIRQSACGQVDLSYFSDAAFLGDSLTVGFSDYQINLSGALICGYTGVGPDAIVNRAAVKSPTRGQEVALDVLAAAQPKKLYILLGTNTLTTLGASDRFLAYYGQMLDELRQTLGEDCIIYVQSIPPVRPAAAEKKPGLASDVLRGVNEQLAQLAASKGCVYLDLWEALADGEGNLKEMIAAPDGVHLSAGNGYGAWVTYLRNHAKYSANNPWIMGSAYSAE